MTRHTTIDSLTLKALGEARALNSMSLQERAQVFFDGEPAALTVIYEVAPEAHAAFARGANGKAFLIDGVSSPVQAERAADAVSAAIGIIQSGSDQSYDWPFGPSASSRIHDAIGLK